MKYLIPILCLFVFSCDDDDANFGVVDCGGAYNENVEIWEDLNYLVYNNLQTCAMI